MMKKVKRKRENRKKERERERERERETRDKLTDYIIKEGEGGWMFIQRE